MPNRRFVGLVLVSMLISFVALANAQQTTIVVDGGSPDWAFLPETGTPIGYFTVGPDVPPAGDGSGLLGTDDSSDGIALISQELLSTPLSEFTALSYWTYTDNAPQAPALQFSVDYDNTDGSVGWQGRLVFEPANAGGVLADSWQQWDTLAGNWWASGSPGNGVCPQGAPCTWAEVLAAFPNAAIHGPALGQFMVKSGSGWSGTITTHFDAIEVATSGGVDVLYDFESTSNQVNTPALGDNGWYSDDTRSDGTATMPVPAGDNLISPTKTDAPEGISGDATVDHDDDIDNQIRFELFGLSVPPPVDEWQGAVHLTIDASAGAAGKSQISHRNNPDITMDLDGFGFGYEVLTPVFLARYSWMADNLGNPGITGALKLGFITQEYPGPDGSPRTGEDAWDKLLVYEPSNGNGGSADGSWQSEVVNFNTGKWWIVDRAAGIATSQSNPMSLAEMSVSGIAIGGRTIADVWAILTDSDTDEEAILTSIQFGIGSNNPGGSVYLNQLETSFYRPGMVTTFGGDPGASAVICVPTNFDARCEAVEASIQNALDTEFLGPEDIILVDSGIFAETLTINSGVMLMGAQAGITGCGRSGLETVITGQVAVAASDVVIDGLTFESALTKVSSIAPVDGLEIRNSRFVGGFEQIALGSGAGGLDITIEDNELVGDAAPSLHSGVVGQLMVRESAPGLYVLRNCFLDAALPGIAFELGSTATSSVRSPVIGSNLFENTAGGIDASAGRVSGAEISKNRFDSLTGSGIQGQLESCLIVDNLFAYGNSVGISLFEDFLGSPPSNASVDNFVLLNCFYQNLGTAMSFSASQAAGTISTNTAWFNDIVENTVGSAYSGAETIDVTSNYWGAADGPSGDGPGSGDPVLGAGLDFSSFLVAPATYSTLCHPVADLSITKVDDAHDAYAVVGAPVIYTITVENLGPFDATNAQVLDPIPAGLSSCSWTCQAQGSATCGVASGTNTIADTVDIPVGDSITYELTCTYDSTPVNFAAINLAFVSAGDQTDGNTANNTAAERTADDGLFEDGFESGDITAWTNG